MEKITNEEALEFLDISAQKRYRWDEWLDLQPDQWGLLVMGNDFICSITSMRNQLYRQGQKRGMHLEILAIKRNGRLSKDCLMYREIEREKRAYNRNKNTGKIN